MIYNKKVLAIIPARAGSKRLPGKNIKLLNDIPLIEYTIQDAIDCWYIDDIIITSDDKEVEKIAIRRGVHFRCRPKYLCRDESPSQEFVDDILETYGKRWDIIVLLQPTSPLRLPVDIINCLHFFVDNKFDTVITVNESNEPNGAVYVFKEKIYTDNTGKFIMPNERSIDINTLEDFNKAEESLK